MNHVFDGLYKLNSNIFSIFKLFTMIVDPTIFRPPEKSFRPKLTSMRHTKTQVKRSRIKIKQLISAYSSIVVQIRRKQGF